MENKKLSYTPPEAEIVLLYSEGIICDSTGGGSTGVFDEDEGGGGGSGNIWG